MPDPRYLTWNDKWLITTDMINCSECWAAQFMSQRDKDFEHASICPRRGPGPAAVHGAAGNAQGHPR